MLVEKLAVNVVARRSETPMLVEVVILHEIEMLRETEMPLVVAKIEMLRETVMEIARHLEVDSLAEIRLSLADSPEPAELPYSKILVRLSRILLRQRVLQLLRELMPLQLTRLLSQASLLWQKQ